VEQLRGAMRITVGPVAMEMVDFKLKYSTKLARASAQRLMKKSM